MSRICKDCVDNLLCVHHAGKPLAQDAQLCAGEIVPLQLGASGPCLLRLDDVQGDSAGDDEHRDGNDSNRFHLNSFPAFTSTSTRHFEVRVFVGCVFPDEGRDVTRM